MIIIHSSNLHWSPLPWWIGRYFKAWREDKDIIGAHYNPRYCLLIGHYNHDTGLWLVSGYKNCSELRLLDKDVVGNVWYAFTAAAARMGTCRPALWPQNIYITYEEKYLTKLKISKIILNISFSIFTFTDSEHLKMCNNNYLHSYRYDFMKLSLFRKRLSFFFHKWILTPMEQ